jgi:Zn-dependent protease
MLSNHMMELLNELAILFPAFLLVFTFRGFFKTLAAKISGDNTGQRYGFLSLNPLVHIDFLGLVVVLFVLFFIGGLLGGVVSRGFLFVLLILVGARWTIPVPVDEQNFKYYSLGTILTSIAGSLGAFILALLFLYVVTYFPYYLFPQYVVVTIVQIFRVIIELAVFFGVLDLIPIPPFDGGRLLQFIVPPSVYHSLENYSIFIIFALFFLPGINIIFFNVLGQVSFFVKQILLSLVF